MEFQPSDKDDRAPNPMKREAASTATARPGKAKRTRTGCLTCRARKVKCDERPGRCRNCERVMLECKWPELRDVSAVKTPRASTSAEQSRPSASVATPRSRQNSCYACRVARCKCSRDRPTCIRCREEGVRCDYETEEDGDTVAPGDASHSSTTTDLAPPPHVSQNDHDNRRLRSRTTSTSIVRTTDPIPRDVLDEHIHAFFQCVYPIQANAFIHRGTLVRDVQAGRVNRMLILALCAVSSRFTPLNDPPPVFSLLHGSPLAADWAREAKAMLILGDEMSTNTVATALLLAKHDINSGRYETAWMLSSIASRAALALGLHKQPDDNLTWIEQETRRRLFWACYCLDRMMSTGVPEYALIRTERVRIQLPCEDHNYLLGIPCVTPVPYLEVEEPDTTMDSPGRGVADREIGLFGHYVQLMGMRYMILGYTRNRDEASQDLPPWEQGSIFSQCVRKMTAWYSSLQPQFQLLSDTIYGRVAQNQLTALIMIHVMYHESMLDLHRVTMPGFPESLPQASLLGAPIGWVEHHQRACVEHARSIGKAFDIVAHKIEIRDLVMFDASLPIYVFEAMQVQVQWLFMLPVEARAETVVELRVGFERLMGYVERMTKYFRQAQWLLREMRKMLLRHGIPVRGGSDYIPPDTSGAQTPHHPWQRRVQSLRRSSETSHLHSALVNEDFGSPYTQTTHTQSLRDQEVLNAPPAFDTNPFAPSLNDSQSLPPKSAIGPAGAGGPEVFDQEDMMMILGRYQEGHVIAEMSGFLSTFGGWTANGVEAGLGAPPE